MRFVFLIIGIAAVALGAIGVVLPFLPSTPFFLLALFCFAKSSPRLHTWFISSKLYKRHLESLVKARSMALRSKIMTIASVTVVMGVGFYFMDEVPAARAVLAVVWAAHIYFFCFRVKTLRDADADADVDMETERDGQTDAPEARP